MSRYLHRIHVLSQALFFKIEDALKFIGGF